MFVKIIYENFSIFFLETLTKKNPQTSVVAAAGAHLYQCSLFVLHCEREAAFKYNLDEKILSELTDTNATALAVLKLTPWCRRRSCRF